MEPGLFLLPGGAAVGAAAAHLMPRAWHRAGLTPTARAERARDKANERFRIAFEHAAIPMGLVSLGEEDRGTLLQANSAYAEMLGRRLDEMLGRRISAWIHPEDLDEAFAQPLARLAAGEVEQIQFERRYLHADGRVICTLVNNALYHDEHDRPVAIAQLLDISERKRLEGQLRHMADHDPLTGLFNRRRYEEELERAMALTRRLGSPLAILALDLDGFKFVNDTLGHAAGDELVRRLAGSLRRTVRTTDVVARTGGDEFALILVGTDETGGHRVAEKLLAEIRRCGSMVAGGRQAHVTASIGITMYDQGDQLTPEDLMVESDIAMYDAKGAGKDQVAVYHRQAGRRERIAARHDWLTRLRTAIDHEQFVLHAQPITPVCSNGVPRFELLLRMKDEQGNLMQPGTFLYNAERLGLMEQIDRWVMTQAVELLEQYHLAGNDIALAVNMSPRTLNAGSVPAHLRSLLSRHQVPEGRLVVEVTETAAISNIEQAKTLAGEVRELGCRLALDDFGAGFATFYYLKHLDFDYIKIDGEFIQRLPTTETDQLVVRAVVDVAQGLGSDTVAEFVQDDETVEMLRELGVGYAQGYHTGRPGPLGSVLPQQAAGALMSAAAING